MRLNKLRRNKLVFDLYNKHKTEDIALAVVWRKYILFILFVALLFMSCGKGVTASRKGKWAAKIILNY
ncbi:hypothetical protein [Myroides injenensis]|uniref:hypothetical protein n=1 Tax=Myroides injenensis TaxID=1183151 RepID=UPI002270FE9F|nr:hypothetical protein [Myroides injenensis]